MKKTLILIFFLSLTIGLVNAEDTIGCPKGIAKGVIWPRITFKMIDFKEKWSSMEGQMVDIDKGKNGLMDASKKELDIRLGYGLTHRVNIGLNFKYEWSNIEKLQNNSLIEYKESDLTQIWLSGHWIFFDKHEASIFSNIKFSLGASYGIAINNSEKNIKVGLGPGVSQYKIGLLWHAGIKNTELELAGHILHKGKGTAKDIKGWGRSGQNIPDAFDYLFKLEYGLSEYFEFGLGLKGWTTYSNDPILINKKTKETFKAYSHNLMIHPVFFPDTHGYAKRKIYAIIMLPLKERLPKTTNIKFALGMMWTFDTAY